MEKSEEIAKKLLGMSLDELLLFWDRLPKNDPKRRAFGAAIKVHCWELIERVDRENGEE